MELQHRVCFICFVIISQISALYANYITTPSFKLILIHQIVNDKQNNKEVSAGIAFYNYDTPSSSYSPSDIFELTNDSSSIGKIICSKDTCSKGEISFNNALFKKLRIIFDTQIIQQVTKSTSYTDIDEDSGKRCNQFFVGYAYVYGKAETPENNLVFQSLNNSWALSNSTQVVKYVRSGYSFFCTSKARKFIDLIAIGTYFKF